MGDSARRIAWKKAISVLGIACSLAYPAARAHAYDEHLCGVEMPAEASALMSTATPPAASRPLAAPEADAMCDVPLHAIDGVPATVDAHEARRILAQAKSLAAEKKYDEALLALRVVEWFAPSLEDRWALLRGEWLRASGHPELAKSAFERAKTSPEATVAFRASIDFVLASLEAGDRRAESELTRLIAMYRDLPDTAELRFTLGRARLQWNNRPGAVEIFRALDLELPGSTWAEKARAELATLRESGHAIPPYSLLERVARAERWVHSGPIEDAKSEVFALAHDPNLTPQERSRIGDLVYRIGRLEGRIVPRPEAASADAEPPLPPEALRRAMDLRLGVATPAMRNPPQFRGGILKQVLTDLRIAARHEYREECDAALRQLIARHDLKAADRVDAAVLAAGTCDDTLIGALLEPAFDDAHRGTAARYHAACALERSGKREEALSEFAHVITTDHTELTWYALWSKQRVAKLLAKAEAPEPVAELVAEPSDDDAFTSDIKDEVNSTLAAKSIRADAPLSDATSQNAPLNAADSDVETGNTEPEHFVEAPEAERQLIGLARRLGEAYPWFARARELVRLGEMDAASDELHEAYLAYKAAKGNGIARTGLEAVYRGASVVRVNIDRNMKRARLQLTDADRRTLADIALALGDPGLAVSFGGRGRALDYPRAYAAHVEKSAQKYGLDPDLLFAVMRVESIYNRRIVSYAGAIGLLQIMPRTGHLIAQKVGREQFTSADLLDPETNVEFAAWYLKSLLDRFDGRLPLAVAAYNGGPHNVRRWMTENPSHMPLDAFLERIPFGQTWRYVRRVIGHYAAYRRHEGEDMITIHTTLPGNDQEDHVGF